MASARWLDVSLTKVLLKPATTYPHALCLGLGLLDAIPKIVDVNRCASYVE